MAADIVYIHPFPHVSHRERNSQILRCHFFYEFHESSTTCVSSFTGKAPIVIS